MKTPASPRATPSRPPAAPRPGSDAATRAGGFSWWPAAVVFLSALLVYGPALRGGFIWDDDGHVTKPALQSLGGLFRIWFEIGASQQYYPVLHTAFWVEHLFFGHSPTGYHVVNVLLHATVACLFARLLWRLRVPGAWLAAGLFALHPVCVESVAWISEQKNTLSAVWYLLAALAYLRFDTTRQKSHYALATFLFLLALGSKTVTATLPAALLVIFWWQRGRLDWRRDVVPLLPWFALSIVAGLTTAWVEHRVVGAENTDYELGPVERVLLASRIVFFYFSKLLLPLDLIFIYPRWTIDAGEPWQYLFLLGLVGLAVAAWRWRAHRGPIAVGLLFVGTLFPALGFVNVYPFMFSFVADHFQYLASLAIFAGAGAGAMALRARWPGATVSVATGTVCVVLGVLTWRQSHEYRDGETLYRATIAKNPGAWMAHNNLASELMRTRRAQEAIPHLEAAVRLNPRMAEPENNLGLALISLNRLADAIPHLERAIQIRPDYVFAHNNLGIALLNLRRFSEAEARLQAALRLKVDYPEAQMNLGLVYAQQDRAEQAIEHFANAARFRPGFIEAEFNWAIGLAHLERFPEAFARFEAALKIDARRPDIQFAYGRSLALDGRTDQALVRYTEAVRLAPEFAEAHYYLGEALRTRGRNAEAAAHLAEARRLGWRP